MEQNKSPYLGTKVLLREDQPHESGVTRLPDGLGAREELLTFAENTAIEQTKKKEREKKHG